MKLKEYIEAVDYIKKDEYIFSYKFDNLFKQLNNNKNVFYYSANWDNTKQDLLNIFNKVDKTNSLLLMTNGDVDIPCIKREYFLQDNIPYSEELQQNIEKAPLDCFLELNLLDKIPNNLIIFCNSVIKKHQNLIMIPLGRDFKGENVLQHFNLNDKKILCYYNCSIPPKSIHWYGRIREHIYNDIKVLPHITCENITQNNNRNIGIGSFINYYNKIANSKFMICPRGCGLDTYRFWDCLYLGCVPIVVKYDGYEQFKDLPILFVNDWKEYKYLTQEQLENTWNNMLEMSFNYDKLKFSWWENKIKSFIQ